MAAPSEICSGMTPFSCSKLGDFEFHTHTTFVAERGRQILRQHAVRSASTALCVFDARLSLHQILEGLGIDIEGELATFDGGVGMELDFSGLGRHGPVLGNFHGQ